MEERRLVLCYGAQLWNKKTEFTRGQVNLPEGLMGAISRLSLKGAEKRMTGSDKDKSYMRHRGSMSAREMENTSQAFL